MMFVAMVGALARAPREWHTSLAAARGAIAEYDGDFMSKQLGLKGGRLRHAANARAPRRSNFFYPHQCRQFTGVHAAKDA